MSDTQQSRATLSRDFVVQHSCLSDITSCQTFDDGIVLLLTYGFKFTSAFMQ